MPRTLPLSTAAPFIRSDLEVHDPGGYEIAADVWRIQSTTAVETVPRGSPSLGIFPIPSTGRLYFEGVGAFSDIAVFDVMGRLVLQATTAAGSPTLDMHDHPPGLYLVRVGSDSRIESRLILIAR